jgi:glycosyltransferase involved in cell wall biosynthesis
MIVALDGTPLTLTSGGLRRYTGELHRALQSTFPEDSYHVLSDQLTPPRNPFDRRWWSIGLPRRLLRLGAHVFHGTDFAVPYLPVCPSVMTVHDLSPWLNPAWHSNAGRVRRRAPLLIRLGIATMLVVPCKAIAQQAAATFQIHPDRIAIVPEAAAPNLQQTTPYESGRPYFLFVGTVEPRKNIPALIEAWRSMQDRADLIIAGRHRPDAPKLPEEAGLHILHEVSEGSLAPLYSGAIALVYPSAYEGFGLPILEAMQCGCPVVASRDPALMETSGGAAIHVDEAELPEVMSVLLANSDLRAHRASLGLIRARDFSWEHTARLTREVYAEAIRRFPL